MKIFLLGHMGRDEATVDRLEGHKLHIMGQWKNPGLAQKAAASGGDFHLVDSTTNTKTIADMVQAIKPDMFLTNFDDALAAGVVDAIEQRVADKRMPRLLIPSPTKAAAKIEWDKFYLRELVDEINPQYNPFGPKCSTKKEVNDAIAHFAASNQEFAVKPRNPTGGKGVKVMSKHFNTLEEGRKYALEVIAMSNQEGVEVQERLSGHEFTLQLITDGKVLIRPPATYDYPYREDGDQGPGTGGMGTFSEENGLLPFINQKDYNEAVALSAKVLKKLKERGLDYRGVFYPTFFKTSQGLKIVEVNARGGDPELINVLDVMEDNVNYGEVLKLIALGELGPNSISYKKLATAMVYLVSPDYAYRTGSKYSFSIDPKVVAKHGCKIRFAATEGAGHNKYQTVGSSRTVGLSALANTPWEARHKIHTAIKHGFGRPLSLKYRYDIADKDYINSLAA